VTFFPVVDTCGSNVLGKISQLKTLRVNSEGALQYKGVWQGVAMDFLKFQPYPPFPTFLRPADGPPLKRSYGLAPPEGGRPASIFYLFGHPMLYAYVAVGSREGGRCGV
jgi:hypothetical protein